jgi:hypothetical protein
MDYYDYDWAEEAERRADELVGAFLGAFPDMSDEACEALERLRAEAATESDAILKMFEKCVCESAAIEGRSVGVFEIRARARIRVG